MRFGAAYALGRVGMASPAVAPRAAEALAGLLTDEASSVRFGAACALREMGMTNPEIAPQAAEALLGLLADEESGVCSRAADALAMIYAAQVSQRGVAEPLFVHLTNPLNSHDRRVASRALFLVTLRDPSRQKPIQDELKSLADRPEPHVRIAANQTLEMLYIADLAHTAASDAKQRDEITSKLQSFVDVTFFGENFSWAAREALNWLYTR